MDGKCRILVVDDDSRMRELVRRYLVSNGFLVDCGANGDDVERLTKRNAYDLMILDIMMPGEPGLEICKRLRGSGDMVPIIFLSAKGDDSDRILGMEVGADDFIPKPFNPKELLVRIHAIIRRSGTARERHRESPVHSFRVGGTLVDLTSRRIVFGDGREHAMTQSEHSILSALSSDIGHPVGRDKIMSISRGGERSAFDRSIDVAIARLRKLLESDGGTEGGILTARGQGYLLLAHDVVRVPPQNDGGPTRP